MSWSSTMRLPRSSIFSTVAVTSSGGRVPGSPSSLHGRGGGAPGKGAWGRRYSWRCAGSSSTGGAAKRARAQPRLRHPPPSAAANLTSGRTQQSRPANPSPLGYAQCAPRPRGCGTGGGTGSRRGGFACAAVQLGTAARQAVQEAAPLQCGQPQLQQQQQPSQAAAAAAPPPVPAPAAAPPAHVLLDHWVR